MRLIFLSLFLFTFSYSWAQPQHPFPTTVKKRPDEIECRQLITKSIELIEKDEFRSHQLAKNAAVLAQKIGNDSLTAIAYRTMAEAIRKKRPEVLYTYDTLFIFYARKSGFPDLKFNSLQLYALDLLNNNSIKKAIPIVNKGLELADSLAIPEFQSSAYNLNAFCLFKQFKVKDALGWYRRALKIAESNNYQEDAAQAKLGIAHAVTYSGKIDSSQALIFEVIDFYTVNKKYVEIGRAYELLAFLYQVRGNLAKAIEYYRDAETNFELAKEPVLVAINSLAIARMLIAQKQFGDAERALHFAEAKFISLKNEGGLVLVKNHWGQYYSASGKMDTATMYFKEAAILNQRLKRNFLDLINNGFSVQNEIRKGSFSKSDSLFDLAIKQAGDILPDELIDSTANRIGRRNNLSPSKITSIKQILKGDTKRNLLLDLDTTLNIYTMSPTKMDSTIKMEYDSVLLQAEMKYKTRIIQDSLLLQKQINTIQTVTLSRKNVVIAASLSIILLASILAIQQSRNRKKAIAAKNKIETLKEDADHRIANTLNAISASIRRTKRTSIDQPSFTLLEERVQPFMKLYQILTETSDHEISMQHYLEEICSGLNKTYGWDKNVTIHVNANTLIDGERALRVALIVNELVTNAFKYAFNDTKNGHISVTFSKSVKDGYALNVADNGQGITTLNKTGTGLMQIKAIAQELQARMEQSNDNGAGFEFYFM